MSSSMASLSSADEDAGPWELTSDPHVTRHASTRLSRTNSYSHFADDESSDASTSSGFADGCSIQGTFPSTERLRVRWASPMKASQIAEAMDGRRRVGIREVKADMTYSVMGTSRERSRKRGIEGLLVRLDYTATCRGVWFPGVATLLGLDAGLDEGEGCDISWAPGMEPKWTVTGGSGFTGFALGKPSLVRSPDSSPSSPTGPPMMVLPSSPDAKKGIISGIPLPSYRQTLSPASLLNAPLPAENVSDYSFDEGSPTSTPTGTISSITSLTQPSSPEKERRNRSRSRSRASSINGQYPYIDTDIDQDIEQQPPNAPITVHVNMNELQPPPKNTFTFSISGVILVTPLHKRHGSPRTSPPGQHSSDTEADFASIVLPTFHISHSDKESITTIVRSELNDALLDVYNAGDAGNGKSTLQKGGHVRSSSKARVATRPAPSPPVPSGFGGWNDESSDNSAHRSRSFYRTPHRGSPRVLSSSILRTPLSMSSGRSVNTQSSIRLNSTRPGNG